MINHSRIKNKKKYTLKVYKGGTITEGNIKNIVHTIIETIFTKIMCLITPICRIIWFKDKFIHSLKLINDILLVTGLYFKNLLYLGYSSNLNNILPKYICFDLFDESVCNAKLNKLIRTKSQKEYNNSLPYELRVLQKGGNLKKETKKQTKKQTIKQRGGTFGKTCKNNQNPAVICYDDRSNQNLKKTIYKPKPPPKEGIDKLKEELEEANMNPDSVELPDKETINMVILSEVRKFDLDDLYRILNVLKILYSLDKDYLDTNSLDTNSLDKSEIPKVDKNDILRIEHNFKKYDTIKEWEDCNDLHLEKISNKQKRDNLKQKCNVKCDDCTMTRQSSIYLPDTTNYSPKFGKSFLILEKILENFYEFNKSNKYNHEKIYVLLNNEDDRIKLFENIQQDTLFDFFNIGMPRKIKDIENDILKELIRNTRLHKKLNTHIIVSKYLLYLLFNKSTESEKNEFKKKFLNSNGEKLDSLIKTVIK